MSRSYLISKSISTIVKIDDSINVQVIFNLNSKVENVEEHHSIVMSHFQLNIDTHLNRFVHMNAFVHIENYDCNNIIIQFLYIKRFNFYD